MSIVLLIVWAAPVTLNGQALTGIKTIGGTTPDYSTLSAAVNDLNINGVGSGGVTFLLRDGTYTESVILTAQGTATDPILFQSESNDASLVTILSGSEVISFTGAQYIRLSSLTINNTGNSGNAVKLQDNADNITIQNSILDGCTTAGTQFANAVVYGSETLSANNCDAIIIDGCTVINGSWGNYLSMNTTATASIINSRFENNYAGAVNISGFSDLMISQNSVISSLSANTGYKGFYVDGCSGNLRITSNYIYTTGTGRIAYGLHLNSSSGSSLNQARVENNSIQVQNENSICYAVYQSNNSNFYRFASNTFYISGGTGSGSNTFNTFTGSDDLVLLNNIFINSSSSTGNNANRCIYLANVSGLQQAENNCYFTSESGNPFTGYFGGAYTAFSSFSAATAETQSINIDPLMVFIDGTGWKASAQELVGIGMTITDISEDIDGFVRFDPTSIGAHELAIVTGNSPVAAKAVTPYTSWISGQTLYLNISEAAFTPIPIRLMDLSGKTCFTGIIEPHATGLVDFSLSEIGAGIYFTVVDTDPQSAGRKLFKTH